MTLLGNGLLGGFFPPDQDSHQMQTWRAAGMPFGTQTAIGYGITLDYGDGYVATHGHKTAESALWRGAHMLFRSNLTRRQLRRAMTKEQRQRLVEIARNKLAG